MIGVVDTRASGATGLMRSHTRLGATLDVHIVLPWLLRGWKNNVEDHLASTPNNVEEHIASTPDHPTT
jgi:hypothetical protein